MRGDSVIEEEKRAVARHVAEMIPDVEVLGLGSGTTVAKFVEELVNLGKRPKVVVTSSQIERVAKAHGLTVVELEDEVEITVDGADEVDPKGNLTKGGGGALLREKVLANSSKRYIIIADHTKLVDRLGTKTPIPVEIVPYGFKVTISALERMFGVKPKLRKLMDRPFVTDNGNFIVDLPIRVERPSEVETSIKVMNGVVDVGIFTGMADEIYVAKGNKVLRYK